MQAERQATGLDDDAFFIERSWREPEQFAALFDRRDELRQLRIRQAAVPELDTPGHAERVAADVTAGSVGALLGAALADLSAGDRDVVVLIAWEQLT